LKSPSDDVKGELEEIRNFLLHTKPRPKDAALPTAERNLKQLSDAHATIVMDTDSGATEARFKRYFEHMEMRTMVQSGLSSSRS
jgi:hypothetical protein